MSNLCSTTAAITDPTALNLPYPVDRSFLPAQGVARNRDGRLTEGTLKQMYEALTNNNAKLMSVKTYKERLSVINNRQNSRDSIKAALENLGEQDKNTMDEIGREFCYYYVRYKYALDTLFTTMVATSTASTLSEENTRNIQAKLNTARSMNSNLNDLIQLTNYIAITRAREMGTQNTDINALNNEIKRIYSNLREANTILKREDATTELRKRMVEFTQEKNLSANSLLSLYGFLNLVALGLLFYISRS